MNNKENSPVVSLTAKDFKWDYFNGQGNGGSNRNKVANCVRCIHEPSNSMGVSQEERSQAQNKQIAFKRCCQTKSFQTWLKLEHQRKLGVLENIEKSVDEQMLKTKVESKDENGKWQKDNSLRITEKDTMDVKNEQ